MSKHTYSARCKSVQRRGDVVRGDDLRSLPNVAQFLCLGIDHIMLCEKTEAILVPMGEKGYMVCLVSVVEATLALCWIVRTTFYPVRMA